MAAAAAMQPAPGLLPDRRPGTTARRDGASNSLPLQPAKFPKGKPAGFAPAGSGDAELPQHRKLLFGEGLRLRGKFGDVVFRALQRLAVFEDALALAIEDAPGEFGPN